MTADTAPRMTRPTRLNVALPQATAGRGGRGAVAGPRRVTEVATMATGAWTDRKLRRYRTRRSVGSSGMRFPRPTRRLIVRSEDGPLYAQLLTKSLTGVVSACTPLLS